MRLNKKYESTISEKSECMQLFQINQSFLQCCNDVAEQAIVDC